MGFIYMPTSAINYIDFEAILDCTFNRQQPATGNMIVMQVRYRSKGSEHIFYLFSSTPFNQAYEPLTKLLQG